MSVMGVDLSNHTFSWFVCSLVEMVVTVGGMTAVMTLGGILAKSDPTLIFVVMLIYGFSVVCYM